MQTHPLLIANVWRKIEFMETACQKALEGQGPLEVPDLPARTPKIVEPKEMPTKKGFAHSEGRAHMLHDLASIELQAAELGLRTLIEFPDAPEEFKEKLFKITMEEVEHLKLCLEGLESLGFSWGDWPVQVKLWQSTAKDDDLLDRILIVHRYLEGAGLDASTRLLKRISGIDCPHIGKAIRKIASDEEAHVEFGSYWFQQICQVQNKDSDEEFKNRFRNLLPRLPRRLEKINSSLRLNLGFTKSELGVLENNRQIWLGGEKRSLKL